MRAGLHLGAGRALATRVEAVGGPRLAQQRLGQLDGEQPFADARRANEEVGVGQPAAPQRPRERLDLGLMPMYPLPGHAPPPARCSPAPPRPARPRPRPRPDPASPALPPGTPAARPPGGPPRAAQ